MSEIELDGAETADKGPMTAKGDEMSSQSSPWQLFRRPQEVAQGTRNGETRWMKSARTVRPWLLVLLIATLYTGYVIWRSGGPLGLVLIGSRFAEQSPTGSEGYDGQFGYYIARDPLGAIPLIDVPAYRYQRILYPLLARLLALGQPALIPWTLPLLNLIALAVGTALLEAMLVAQQTSRWYALTAGLYAGQLLSLRVDLPEPLALTLGLMGMWLFERGRWLWSAAFFALAIFGKETMLILGLAYVLSLAGRRDVKKSLVFAAVQLIPFGLYQLGLYLWLGAPGLGSGGAGATSFEIIPLAGFFKIGQAGWNAFRLYLIILGPIVIWPVGWSLWATGKDILQRQWHPWTLALSLNALMIPFLPHSTFREILAMLRLSVPLVALFILYSARAGHRRALNYSPLWLVTLMLMIKDPYL